MPFVGSNLMIFMTRGKMVVRSTPRTSF